MELWPPTGGHRQRAYPRSRNSDTGESREPAMRRPGLPVGYQYSMPLITRSFEASAGQPCVVGHGDCYVQARDLASFDTVARRISTGQ